MSKILTAVFDGEVLRPDSTLDLQPDTRYVITIQSVESQCLRRMPGMSLRN
ncbi:MAG: antitoxin family protein [Chroococcidiopsidaceae cyanobacterium CP_BM_ER_R8_30]|nr:antitoxin family protein [Chroococcidiopsidaceae cyanobacterium CP_BM_ER_R8_30]